MTSGLSNFAARLDKMIRGRDAALPAAGGTPRAAVSEQCSDSMVARLAPRGASARSAGRPANDPIKLAYVPARADLQVSCSQREQTHQTVGSQCEQTHLKQTYETDFNPLTLELFALQFGHNPAYRKICEARGLTPKVVGHWTQIPFVPTAAFKEMELTSLAPHERTSVFYSSGTTEQKLSRHFHSAESLAVYEASLWNWFESEVLDIRREALGAGHEALSLVILTPPPAQAPNSSLVHMFEIIRQKMNAPENVYVGKISDGAWTLDFDRLFAELSSTAPRPAPRALFLLGTAFSFVHLFDFLAENNLKFQLPENSRVMETGGYKNRSRSLPKEELHSFITERLGVPRENIICEYGMSELSSQAYSQARGATREASGKMITSPAPKASSPAPFRFPPWSRVQIISPETGREVADGETGLIRVFDLANVFSVAAIQTEDLGIRCGDGFELIGRAQLAEPRGCSLMTA
jgi:hypothetical protein